MKTFTESMKSNFDDILDDLSNATNPEELRAFVDKWKIETYMDIKQLMPYMDLTSDVAEEEARFFFFLLYSISMISSQNWQEALEKACERKAQYDEKLKADSVGRLK